MAMNVIPIVDFAPLSLHRENVSKEDLKAVGEQICKGFEEIGFVYLKNIGVSSDLIDEVNRLSGEFFDKPEADKAKYVFTTETLYGYAAIGLEAFDADNPGDYKQSYDIRAVKGSNPEPLPDDVVPGFSKAVIEFMELNKVATLRMLEALSLALKLEGPMYLPDLHKEMLTEGSTASCRCLRYPPIKGEIKKGQVRLSEHTDYGTVSLVYQDSVGGLQVKVKDGSYVEAVPIPDTALVNVGDVLQFWSNGRLRSNPHRILAPVDPQQRASCRRSLCFFAHPDKHVPIASGAMKRDVINTAGSTDLKFSAKELEGMTAGEFAIKRYFHTYAPTNTAA